MSTDSRNIDRHRRVSPRGRRRALGVALLLACAVVILGASTPFATGATQAITIGVMMVMLVGAGTSIGIALHGSRNAPRDESDWLPSRDGA